MLTGWGAVEVSSSSPASSKVPATERQSFFHLVQEAFACAFRGRSIRAVDGPFVLFMDFFLCILRSPA